MYNPKPFTWDKCKLTNNILSCKNKKQPEWRVVDTLN